MTADRTPKPFCLRGWWNEEYYQQILRLSSVQNAPAYLSDFTALHTRLLRQAPNTLAFYPFNMPNSFPFGTFTLSLLLGNHFLRYLHGCFPLSFSSQLKDELLRKAFPDDLS